jgi:hypothetical protein
VELKLLSVRDYPDGVVRLHYVVERPVEKPKSAAKKGKLKSRPT